MHRSCSSVQSTPYSVSVIRMDVRPAKVALGSRIGALRVLTRRPLPHSITISLRHTPYTLLRNCKSCSQCGGVPPRTTSVPPALTEIQQYGVCTEYRVGDPPIWSKATTSPEHGTTMFGTKPPSLSMSTRTSWWGGQVEFTRIDLGLPLVARLLASLRDPDVDDPHRESAAWVREKSRASSPSAEQANRAVSLLELVVRAA